MFDFLKTSLEKRVRQLAGAVNEAATEVIAANFFNFPVGGVEERRYAMGTYMLASLMCEDEITTQVASRCLDMKWSLGISRLLNDALVEPTSSVCGRNVRFSEMVVWQKEIETIRRRSIRKWGKAGVPMPVEVPLPDLLDELYCVRMPQMTIDFTQGAQMQIQEGPWSQGLLKPLSSTFIAQITGDETKAADEDIVLRIAVTLSPHWMLLREVAQSVLQ